MVGDQKREGGPERMTREGDTKTRTSRGGGFSRGKERLEKGKLTP